MAAMLDADTKRRIDTARALLVGKVPDPKSQVEQITIALIYKIMDAIDAESEEFGGRRSFFAGDFARYRWPNLVGPGRGGQETLNLYAEALRRLAENPELPPLFRAIFDNAFLPHNDPETLREFLKVIDEFPADDPATLGDPFEYLLSVWGVQPAAGQFLTPRHIIDFIVQAVDPQKHETILDPACGTGGFLIAARQHILNANSGPGTGSSANGGGGPAPLTPDELTRLAANLQGYDISPDMVRLARVNLYLHRCPAPEIYEYDTPTSEERWEDRAEVILANPPFMSPKGGIRPHQRFAVQSKRSEALFVDYIAGHLKAHGRAGVIVPEGVIFQAQRAYRQLRKMLVEQYLEAVVSLPAGVFQPYSGVKTSILLFDRARAVRSGHIALLKVEEDGFDRGAQRRPIGRNDLPETLAAMREWRELDAAAIGAGPESWPPALRSLAARGAARLVAKARLAADGDYNLSGERYRDSSPRTSRYPIMELGKVSEVIAGQSPPGESYNSGGIGVPFYQGKTEFGELYIGKPAKWTTAPQRFAYPGDILMSVRAPVGPVNLTNERICIGRGLAAIKPENGRLLTEYAFYLLRSIETEITGNAGAAFATINKKEIQNIKIPLPPLAAQRELVAEIEGYQRVRDGAQAVVDNYRPHIAVDPAWPTAKVASLFRRVEDTVLPESLAGPVNYIGLENISQGSGQLVGESVLNCPAGVRSLKNVFAANDILYGKLRPNLNKVWLADRDGICSTDIFVIRPKSKGVLPTLYADFFRSDQFNAAVCQHLAGAQLPRVSWRSFSTIEIPLPPLAIQQAIAAEIGAEQGLVAASRELAGRMAGRIAAAAGRAWGRLTWGQGVADNPGAVGTGMAVSPGDGAGGER